MRALLALPLFALLAVGCDSDGFANSIADFGDPYSIQSEDDPRPAILEGRLSVPVEYSGGCSDHDFVLRSRLLGDAATVWLEHDANGDMCEAFLSETIQTELPTAIAAAERISIRVPLRGEGEATIRLR